MIRRFTISLILLTCLISTADAQTPAPPEVHAKLSFAENKTVYRIGEPIKLVMEFTADREGYMVEFLPDGNEAGSDTVSISPEIGVTRWYDEFSDNNPGIGRHTFSMDKLTSSPKRVELTLNDRLRFDSPGRYTVSVTTRRVSPAARLTEQRQPFLTTTNSLSFQIEPMSEADEAKEVKRLSDLLDTKRASGASAREIEHVVGKHLSYLTGEPSTREKVRRFLNPPQRDNNYGTQIWYGLFIARNRALVLKLLEAGLRDPSIPVTYLILGATTRLKTMLTHGVREKGDRGTSGMLQPGEDPRSSEIREAYVAELAASLSKRTGPSLTTTAVTILSSVPQNVQTLSPARREAQRILVQQFDALHPYTQEWLLRVYWDALRDPAITPALKKMWAAADPAAKNVRETALQRLMEMAPDEARSYVVAEIREPNSAVDPKILGTIEDKFLPEVDAPLLEQIRRASASTQNRDRIFLKFKIDLLARFATDSIYQELMELYRTVGEKLERDSRAGLLAYFAKHNEQQAMPLIEQVVSELKPGDHNWLLGDLTRLYYSESIGAILKKILETDDYAHVSNAAYLIGKHGAAGDERVLEARLKRWREEWGDRVAEAEARHQGQIERELIWALLNGTSWKLSPERVQELKKSCLTQVCKQSNLIN